MVANNRIGERFLLHSLCLFLCSAIPLNIFASEEGPVAWLERMQHAIVALNYKGVLVYLHGDQIETMQLLHIHSDGREREHLLSLNGELREVFRDGESLLCILPGKTRGSLREHRGHGIRSFRSFRVERLASYYQFELNDGNERVAGRSVQRLRIEPRDHYRYGIDLYLDRDHALPLRTLLRSGQGNTLSQMMFVQIEFITPSEEILQHFTESNLRDRGLREEQIRPYSAADSDWNFGQLPAGFEPWLHKPRSGENAERGVEQIVLSDGLATLSLYLEHNDDEGLQGHSTVGAVNAYGLTLGRYQVTAVGEVPKATVRAVAQAVTLRRGAR